jgi:LVIVD repeat
MNKQKLVKAFAIATVALLGLLPSNSLFSADGGGGGKRAKFDRPPSMGPVPKAHCGRFDWTESGLQGQTTAWERESGDSEGGYNCNLELVGQFRGEGAFSQDGPAYYAHCAYMATENKALQQHPGIVVIDVSDPTNPVPTAYLDDTPAGLNPHENVKVNQKRGLLGLAESNGPNFAVYDLTQDCTHPKLASSITVPGSSGHMGGWAEDGKTYYIGQSFTGIGGTMAIVDVTDPYNAQPLPTWTFTGNGRPHDLSTNKEGTRLYAGQAGAYGTVGNTAFGTGPDGLVILDVSDYQFRRPDPQIKVVSTVFWDDQGTAEQMLPLYYSNGHSYIVSTDESGGQNGVGGLAAACARGASPYGYSNIIDITDETNPKIVSKIMLEVHDPANCETFLSEPPEVGAGNLDYSTERCAPDRPDNPTMLACGSRGTGTRVYDVRDILHPKEIAYWKGPAPRTAFLPGSGQWSPGVDRTVEKQAGLARFVKVPAADGKGRELHLWIVGDGNGFQVLRFTDSFMQTKAGKAIHADALRDSAE